MPLLHPPDQLCCCQHEHCRTALLLVMQPESSHVLLPMHPSPRSLSAHCASGGRGAPPKPVTKGEGNTALLSGFSGAVMKRLLATGTVASPEEVMLDCLEGLYDHLTVVD